MPMLSFEVTVGSRRFSDMCENVQTKKYRNDIFECTACLQHHEANDDSSRVNLAARI